MVGVYFVLFGTEEEMIQALKFWFVTALLGGLFFIIQQIVGSPLVSLLVTTTIVAAILVVFVVVRAATRSRVVLVGLLFLGLLVYASYAKASSMECRRTGSATQECSSYNEKKQRTGKFICRTHKGTTTCTRLW
jgi:hypothetical protein